jgi:hypothetical protein
VPPTGFGTAGITARSADASNAGVLNFHLHCAQPSPAERSFLLKPTACAIDDRQKNSNTSL